MHSFQIPLMGCYLRRETCQTEVEMLRKWWVVLRACFFVLCLFMVLLLSLLFHYYYCYGNNITLLIDIVIIIISKSSVFIDMLSTVGFAWQRCSRYANVSSFMLFYTCTFLMARYLNISWTILELFIFFLSFYETSSGKCWSGFFTKPSIFKQPPEKACYFHDVTMVVTNRQHGRHI